MKILSSILIVCLSVAGCGVGNKPPDGYIAECYGGDWQGKMVGQEPSYQVVVDIEQPEWLELAELIEGYAISKELAFFNTSEETKELSMLYMSACSKDGIWIHADKRVWSFEGQEPHSPLPLMVTVVVYDNAEQWIGFVPELDKLLKSKWPDRVDENHGFNSSLKNSLF
ncbi:hypothetical protein CWB73_07660 [Pseudoalteromonas phenolica]|uniref:Uncharacterized protein n=1 Tax=Pseudoalteromonas phenolica TaxID=161398 RepID=A0A5S3YVX6_9GAMM|nr:hypothetical protein [Pseudoalteromonas phenolica]TMP81450.1 hypothetical protein CWB73_07660 [Pseudoalteromonas phenolica]